MDAFWDACITRALSHEEMGLAFLWLKDTKAGSDGYVAFGDGVISHLFTERMRTMDLAELNPAGFAVFERFFYYINEKVRCFGRVFFFFFFFFFFASIHRHYQTGCFSIHL